MKEKIKRLVSSLLGDNLVEEYSVGQWYKYRLGQVPSIKDAIAIFENRWGSLNEDVTESPIFLFSAEWRSGSTLLQRLINSDQTMLMWGEPFSRCNIIPSLADSIRVFYDGFPSQKYFIDSDMFSSDVERLSSRWTANLFPDIGSLVESHRVMIKRLFEYPASSRGFSRWGIKEVRWDISCAYYLKWLFPHAKFLFLYRNPYKAYRSCWNWRDLYMRWPDQPVPNPETFGRYWQEMVQGYIEGHQEVDGLLIKYEEFCAGSPSVQELSEYLNLSLDEKTMTTKIGSLGTAVDLSHRQKTRLRKHVNPLAAELGYSFDS
ncbi:MAG: hypothetical protein F6K30_10450 [Cyanothece sp. SIO2G6]|nr:hypothetical protein [Cyanothece sp. SIO2G6]